MSVSTSDQRKRRFIQFQLGTLLLMVVLVALAMGWWLDHRRMAERLRQAELDNKVYIRQLAEYQKPQGAFGGTGSGVWHQPVYYWANADEFIQALKSDQDEHKFLGSVASLTQSADPTFEESVRRVLTLLDDPEQATRMRAVVTLNWLRKASEEKMGPHADKVVAKLIPLLDQGGDIVGEAIRAIEVFGPAARPALDALKARMQDDKEWYAPNAALAIAKIDPSIDVSPRLIELIRSKHGNRMHAAFYLHEHVAPEVARKVLVELYEETGGDIGVVNMLNQIKQ